VLCRKPRRAQARSRRVERWRQSTQVGSARSIWLRDTSSCCAETCRLRATHSSAALKLTSPRPTEPTQINAWSRGCGRFDLDAHRAGSSDAAVLLESRRSPRVTSSRSRCTGHDPARALALAEAKLERFEQATARIEAVIERPAATRRTRPEHRRELRARARIAVWAHDQATASRYATFGGASPRRRCRLRHGYAARALLEEARDAGLELTLEPSAFEVSVLGVTRARAADPHEARVTAELAGCEGAPARAERALTLLCDAGRAARGHLYLRRPRRARSRSRPPSRRARRRAYALCPRLLRSTSGRAGDEPVFTQATQMTSLPGAASFIDPRGVEHRALMLTCKQGIRVGVRRTSSARGEPDARPDPEIILLTSAVAAGSWPTATARASIWQSRARSAEQQRRDEER